MQVSPFLLCLLTFIQTHSPLYEIWRDAQAATAIKTTRGQLTASITNTYTKGTLRATVKAVWDHDDVFFLARISDPENALFRDNTHKKSLSESGEWIGLVIGNQFSFYNPYTNTLHIYKQDRRNALMAMDFLEVIPSLNWYQCCPPHTSSGSPYTQYIVERSPFHREGSQIELKLEQPSNILVFNRFDPQIGTMRCKADMNLGGAVTELIFNSDTKSIASTTEHMEWYRTPHGEVVLRNRLFQSFALGSANTEDFRSELKIDSVTLLKDRSSLISLEQLKAQLPRNAMITDHVAGKSYPMVRKIPPDELLKQLSRKVQNGNFIKGK